MRVIAECDVVITELESTMPSAAAYRKSVRRWAAALMHYPNQWQTPRQAQTPFTDLIIDTLQGLATLIDARGPMLQPVGEEKLRELLDEVEELLRIDDSIDGLVRAHLYEVIQMLRQYLDDIAFYREADLAASLRDL